MMKWMSYLFPALVLFADSASVAQNFWEPASGTPVGGIYAFALDKSGNLFAGTDVGLYRSSDYGKSWITLNVDSSYIDGFQFIAVDSSGNIYAGGDGAYRSTDDGYTWVRIDSVIGPPGDFIDVHAFGVLGNKFLFFCADDGIYRSSNSGDSWEKIQTTVSDSSALSIATDAKGNVFVSNQQGVLRSTDSGNTWETANSGLPDIQITRTICAPGNNVFVIDGSAIFESTNEGNSWENTLLISGSAFDANANNHFVWVNNGQFGFRDIDAGNN